MRLIPLQIVGKTAVGTTCRIAQQHVNIFLRNWHIGWLITFFRFRDIDFAFHNMFYYIRKWEQFHDILIFYSTPYERDFWEIWWKVHDGIIYLFMKQNGNTAWRSRYGQMIQARQIRLLHWIVMLDYYLCKTMQKM